MKRTVAPNEGSIFIQLSSHQEFHENTCNSCIFYEILASVSLQCFGRVSKVPWSANQSALLVRDSAQPDPCSGRISKAAKGSFNITVVLIMKGMKHSYARWKSRLNPQSLDYQLTLKMLPYLCCYNLFRKKQQVNQHISKKLWLNLLDGQKTYKKAFIAHTTSLVSSFPSL